MSALLPTPRRCWSYERQECWFQDLWDHPFDERYHGGDRWRRDFGMNIETFVKLDGRLTPFLQTRDTVNTFLLFYFFIRIPFISITRLRFGSNC